MHLALVQAGRCALGLVYGVGVLQLHLGVLRLLSHERLHELLNLREGVLAKHIDGLAALLGELERLGAAAVVVLGGQEHVGLAEVGDQFDRCVDAAHGLHELALVDAVGQDVHRFQRDGVVLLLLHR